MINKKKKSIKSRIENAVKVIEFAIDNKISVKEASVKCGYSNTYVKNIKIDVYDKYTNSEISDSEFNAFQNTYLKYLELKKAKFNKSNRIDESGKPHDLPKNEGKVQMKTNGNTAEYEWVNNGNYPMNHIKTLDGLLTKANVDLDVWKVKDHVINKWDVTSWKSGLPVTVENWQIKARLERDIKFVKEKIAGETFQKMVKDYRPPALVTLPKEFKTDENGNLLEIPIFDLHIGKLAWGGETFENYDVKIARKRFLGSIITLLERAEGFKYDRILFPIGNDFFNSDTMENTTTKGTPQDEDLRWQKTFDVGSRLLIDAINILKQTGVPIDVMVIPGNHDFERSYYLGSVLQAWFNNDSSVQINNGASPRKYYKYGNTLLGFTHGSEEKESSLPMLMAIDIESKPMWSETKFHEWHLGHIHRKKNIRYTVLDKAKTLNEDLGVTIRYLSSLTGTEEWHHKKGFVGSTKAADAFVWNHEFGLIAHLNTNLIID